MGWFRGERGRPSTDTWPPVGRCRPRITRSSVVLPAPLGPISPVNSPAWTVKLTSSRICRPAKRDADLVDVQDLGRGGGAGVVGHHSFWVEILLATAFSMAFTSASIQDW